MKSFYHGQPEVAMVNRWTVSYFFFFFSRGYLSNTVFEVQRQDCIQRLSLTVFILVKNSFRKQVLRLYGKAASVASHYTVITQAIKTSILPSQLLPQPSSICSFFFFYQTQYLKSKDSIHNWHDLTFDLTIFVENCLPLLTLVTSGQFRRCWTVPLCHHYVWFWSFCQYFTWFRKLHLF